MNHPSDFVRARKFGGGVVTIVAATIFAFAASNAVAQTPPATPATPPAANTPKPPPKGAKKPPAKKPDTAAPEQQPQQEGQSAAIVPQLIYTTWTKVCPPKEAMPTAGAKQACFVFIEGVDDAGVLVVRAALKEVEGDPKKSLIISFIYGVDLMRGTGVAIDQNTPAAAAYLICLPPNYPPLLADLGYACVSQYDVTSEFINGLKKGKLLTLFAMLGGQTMTPRLMLTDFAKAYDGAPTDLKAKAEAEQKMKDALRERAKKKEEELARKGGQPGSKQ